MTAAVIRFPVGRRPIGYEDLVAALDLAVAERRAPAGAIFLLFGTPGSKHYKGPKADTRGRLRAPALELLREHLEKCAPAAAPRDQTP